MVLPEPSVMTGSEEGVPSEGSDAGEVVVEMEAHAAFFLVAARMTEAVAAEPETMMLKGGGMNFPATRPTWMAPRPMWARM
jgi:hypothetical protein